MTTTDRLTPDEAGLVFVTPAAYADEARFHEACRVLRHEDPVHLVESADFLPFHVLTKHADVLEVELHPAAWTNGPLPVLATREAVALQEAQGVQLLRTLIHLDGEEHKAYRGITVDWFTPKSLVGLEPRLAQLAKEAVDRMVALGSECDFARDIAMPFPLQVILSILGLPEGDYPRMLKLTQELFGASDPEVGRGDSPEDVGQVIADFFAYFTDLVNDRQANPTDDLASVIANARVDGQPYSIVEQISYYVIIATAGHDTTSSAMAGGVQALVENQDQLQRLRDDPALLQSAPDEIIRWVTPVKHFMRTATEPYTLRDHRFETGDWVLLSYPSANRDEDVFADPARFDVGRTPNKHLAFGFGAHYCLGAQLAKMEIRALLAELVPRLQSAELAGTPELTSTLFVGGLKHLPLKYAVT
jgi:cytochrome P450